MVQLALHMSSNFAMKDYLLEKKVKVKVKVQVI